MEVPAAPARVALGNPVGILADTPAGGLVSSAKGAMGKAREDIRKVQVDRTKATTCPASRPCLECRRRWLPSSSCRACSRCRVCNRCPDCRDCPEFLRFLRWRPS
jgi:hypothetical protein